MHRGGCKEGIILAFRNIKDKSPGGKVVPETPAVTLIKVRELLGDCHSTIPTSIISIKHKANQAIVTWLFFVDWVDLNQGLLRACSLIIGLHYNGVTKARQCHSRACDLK